MRKNEFAQRVERLCDFLLGRLYEEIGRNGSEEQVILEKLRDEAADIQVTATPVSEVLMGLKEFMGGLPSGVPSEN